MLGSAMCGMFFVAACPKGYEPLTVLIRKAKAIAKKNGGSVQIMTDPLKAAKDADVIYTDVWVSMGQEAEKKEREEIFMAYQINQVMMDKAHPDAIAMHCLPAHRDKEISAEVMDGPHSVVFDQAENRLHAQKAILMKLLGE